MEPILKRMPSTKFYENNRKKDLNLSGFYECGTGLTDAFDFTRKRVFGHFPFRFIHLDARPT
jgi:hypothetical protein